MDSPEPLGLAPLQALEKGVKKEREAGRLLMSGDDVEGSPPMPHGGRYKISFHSPGDEETESWRDEMITPDHF